VTQRASKLLKLSVYCAVSLRKSSWHVFPTSVARNATHRLAIPDARCLNTMPLSAIHHNTART